MHRLAGKAAIVTGGAQGIGEGVARVFASEGARVVVADVNDEVGEKTAASIDGSRFVHLDVSDEASWTQAIEAATSAFGPVDVLVNNAGISQYMPIAMLSLDDYMKVITTNQVGCFLGMRAAFGSMVDNGGGSIVNISSIFGLVGTAFLASYTATKFAIAGMTRVAAFEFAGSGVRVNCIHPGGVNTPAISSTGSIDIAAAFAKAVPMKRIGEPEEIGKACLFFASDDASYVTGASLVVDGGMISCVTLEVG